MAQLMPLPLTVSCFSKIQIGFTFLVLAHPGSPGKRAIKRVCVCVLLISWLSYSHVWCVCVTTVWCACMSVTYEYDTFDIFSLRFVILLYRVWLVNYFITCVTCMLLQSVSQWFSQSVIFQSSASQSANQSVSSPASQWASQSVSQWFSQSVSFHSVSQSYNQRASRSVSDSVS